MDFNNTSSSWLQPQQSTPSQHVVDAQSTHHEQSRSLSADDWNDRATLTGTTPNPLQQTTSLDLSFTLGDLSAPNSAPTLSPGTSNQSYYGQSFQPSSIYFASTPGPYNAISYGAWAGSPQAAQLPLSSYSTLNGATSGSSSMSPQAQQQQLIPPHQQPMMIDPALTSMNGSTTNAISPHYLHTAPQQSSRPSYQFQSTSHPALTIGSPYVPASPYYPSLQHQSQPQGTLSPQALHTPSTPSISSAAYPPPSSSAVTGKTESSEVRVARFQAAIRPLLQPNAFTGAAAVNSLVSYIVDYGSSEVDAAIRIEILTKIRDNAGNHYFRAWADSLAAIELTREWLKAGFTAKGDAALVDTIMPLLQIIDRLPLTIESLKNSKLGKIVVKLVKDPPAPAIKDFASNLERKWRQLLDDLNANIPEDAKSKKRKPNEPPATKNPPPTKKASITPAPVKAIKKDTKTVVTAVKDAKSDSSFFSAPKPKPRLPSFKKAPVAPPASTVKKEVDPKVAQPSSIDPFQEVLKSLGKAVRKESPATSTPPPIPVANSAATGLTKSGKKKKTVSWAPEGQLEMIKYIEKAIYDDDDGTHGPHLLHSLRDLDRGEGAALHAHLFEEAIDWYEPIPLEIVLDGDLPARGQDSVEKITQEEREQTALGALYMSAAQIPDSPSEPATVMPEEQVDRDVKVMTCGPEVDLIFWSSPPVPTHQTVADLMSQLMAGSVPGLPMSGQAPAGSLDLKSVGIDAQAVAALQNLPPEHLQILQQLAQQQTAAQLAQQVQQQHQGMFDPGIQPPHGGLEQDWNANASQHHEYGHGQGYPDDRDRRWGDSRGLGRGRGRGRGRGDDGYRNNKRKPCSFYPTGRCKYGDKCDFSHEGPVAGGSTY